MKNNLNRGKKGLCPSILVDDITLELVHIIRSIISYTGGKYTLVPKINLLLQYAAKKFNLKEYYEPFGGGQRCLINLNPSLFEKRVYCEKSFSLSALMSVVKDEDSVKKLIRILETRDYSLAEFMQAKKITSIADQLATENYNFSSSEKLYAAARMYNLIMYSNNADMKNFRECEDTYFMKIGKLDSHWPVMKNVKIFHGDGLSLIRHLNGFKMEDWLIYFDPPYVPESMKKGKGHYKASWSMEQHLYFVNFIKEAKSKIVVSGYCSELYDNALTGWYKLKIMKKFVSSSRKRGMYADEYIYFNFEIPQTLVKLIGISELVKL